jgi:hypothetical protein
MDNLFREFEEHLDQGFDALVSFVVEIEGRAQQSFPGQLLLVKDLLRPLLGRQSA